MASSDRSANVLTPPVLGVTRFDRAAALIIAAFLGIAAICVIVTSLWIVTRQPPAAKAVPVEMVDLPGGFEDGAIDETLRVDSPLPEVPNAAPVEQPSEQLEIAESLETVTDVTAVAAEPSQQQFETGVKNTGVAGSAKGTGRRGFGAGTGTGGIPREQRWFVRFGERVSLEDYAKQLEFFGIELGVVLPQGQFAYLTQLTRPQPTLRRVTEGASESRMHMAWQGGERRAADVELFAKAGLIVPAEAAILHFYPAAVENQLAQLERAYRGRSPQEIKRTYYVVEATGSGYRFSVVRQLTVK